MPEVRAWSISFNPTVLPYAQDLYSNTTVIEHVTKCLVEARQPFSLTSVESQDPAVMLSLEGRLSRVGIVLVVMPGQEAVAEIVDQNLRAYARWHGYALYRYDHDEQADSPTLNILLNYAMKVSLLHEQLFCVTADVLIHRIRISLPEVLGNADVLMARSPIEGGIDLTMILLRKTPGLLEWLRIAISQEDGLIGRRLASKLSEGKFNLADFATLAPHSAFRDPSSFLVRYNGLPDNIRRLVMQADAAHVVSQLKEPPIAPQRPTSLSWLRSDRFRKGVISIVALSLLVSILARWL